jgi:amino acid adenylation domain-containing protein
MYELFAQACRTHPSRPALVSATVRLDYAELERLVGHCARQLECQVPAQAVGFELGRVEAVVLILACLKAGNTFVPIDAGTAPATADRMLAAAHCGAHVDRVDMASGELGLRRLAAAPAPHMDGIMSIMFTSGSTGRPKGVMVRAAAVSNLLHAPDFFALAPDDVFATYSPLSFDASTFEIFTPLLNGNTLVALDKEDVLDPRTLAAAVREYGISVMWLTAGLFQALVVAGRYAGLTHLRSLLVGGDKVDWNAASIFLDAAPGVALYNGYGPTENTVFTTVARLDRAALDASPGSVPIGRPVRAVQCVLRDEAGELIAGPGSGRLLVSGAGLTAGYLDAADDALQPHPAAVSGRFYDTGDEVRRDAGGTYYFVGRKDAQVKLNGHRVDLHGIEQRCIRAGLAPRVHALYSEALRGLVLVCADGSAERVTHGAPLLAPVLSDWERPKRIVHVAEWPLTANGKTDAGALRARAGALIAAAGGGAGTVGDTGDPLTALAEGLLGVPVANRHARLFDLGFDSISILGLQAGLDERFGVRLDLLDIYEAASLAGIEEMIRARSHV